MKQLLVIFDIDGTMIKTHSAEIPCFLQALQETTGIKDISLDLLTYKHVTDKGIAIECIENHFQRTAKEHELALFENRFLHLLEEAIHSTPIEPISGIENFIDKLQLESDIHLAIATGAYLRSAQLKLQHTSLMTSLPYATSNDSINRRAIMEKARIQAQQFYSTEYDSVIYIGDGPWDVRAANSLRWPFLGIASNYSADHLKNFGATMIIEDFDHEYDAITHYFRNAIIR
jgi:phosphoglycolate phosphatase-like HAD superfamily hydrolase